MQKSIRQTIIKHLWEQYRLLSPEIQHIEQALKQKGIGEIYLDHFAVIDLPGPFTGIPALQQLFSWLGYEYRGNGYLPEKQNDFLWMAEVDCMNAPAISVLPQAVVADFRLEEMPSEVRNIIEHYSSQSSATSLSTIKSLFEQYQQGDETAAPSLIEKILQYLQGRDWPLPTVKEFNTVHAFNELLAWVLIFGRRPNHFTISVHLLDHFKDLEHFHSFIENDLKLELNRDGNVIKGSRESGIAQGSTTGAMKTIPVKDGSIILPTDFIEFVWRFEQEPDRSKMKPLRWNDFFTGFIARQANYVVESLYQTEK